MGKYKALMNKVSIIIPIFNEAATVRKLLDGVYAQSLPQNLKKEMILVESNSPDGSREIVKNFFLEKKDGKVELKLILQNSARGKGNATREGLLSVTGDICLIQDADLEYDLADYQYVLEPILEGHADFVLGSRHMAAGTWKIRKFTKSPIKSTLFNIAGVFFHSFFNVVYGVKLTDPTTMFKVFKTDCIRNVKFESNRFDFDWELAAKLIRLGYAPLEVPVSYNSRTFAEGKKVSVLKDTLRFVIAILKFRIKRIERFQPNELKNIQTQTVAQSSHL
jgi:glycosyltransferase involved in cell wall biosynthesis